MYCEQSDQVPGTILALQASSILPISVLKSFLGGKVQQYGVLVPQMYNISHCKNNRCFNRRVVTLVADNWRDSAYEFYFGMED